MGSYADSCHVVLLQGIELIGQSSDMREFDRNCLFAPSPLVFRESACEGGEAGFMVLAIEAGSAPSSKRSLHWEFEKATSRAGSETNTSDNILVGGTQLIFQKHVILQQREVRRDSSESLIQISEDCDFKD
jgi:hypothetical protein